MPVAGVVSKHLSPELGHLLLPKLTPQHIERLYIAKRGELSPAGVRYIHQVLHAALAHAARMRMIPYNPADGVAPPRPVQREMLYLPPACDEEDQDHGSSSIRISTRPAASA